METQERMLALPIRRRRTSAAGRIRSAVKNALWAASRHLALHGLCSWQHERHWVLF